MVTLNLLFVSFLVGLTADSLKESFLIFFILAIVLGPFISFVILICWAVIKKILKDK